MENPPPAPVRPPGEPVKTVEPLKSSEKELFNSHFRALHGRILLGGDTLNPDNKNILPVNKEALAGGNSQILNECATNCRKKVATVEKDQLEGEINSRVAKNTQVLKQDLSKIESFDQEKVARWKATLTKLFGKDTAQATEAEVRVLFDKYFYSKDKLGNDSNTDLFAEDVLRAFGEEDIEQIEENADCIIWYARICGFTQDYSETVFKHQITAKALYKNNPDQLVNELNQKGTENQLSRINNPNGDENQVLQFIWGNRGRSVTVSSPSEATSAQTEEEKKLMAQKSEYEQSRDQINQFLINPDSKLEQVNQGQKNINLPEIQEEDLKGLRTDEGKRKRFIIEIILGQQKVVLETQHRIQVANNEFANMSENEKQQLQYIGFNKKIEQLNQMLKVPKPEGLSDEEYLQRQIEVETQRKQAIEELEKLPEEIRNKIQTGEIEPEEVQQKLNQLIETQLKTYQPKIDAQVETLRKQIYQWEGIKDKEEEPEGQVSAKVAEEKSASEDRPEGEKKKKEGLLTRLKARFSKKP